MMQFLTTLQIASSQVHEALTARHRKLVATRESGLEAATVAIIAVASIVAAIAVAAIVTTVVAKYGSKLSGA